MSEHTAKRRQTPSDGADGLDGSASLATNLPAGPRFVTEKLVFQTDMKCPLRDITDAVRAIVHTAAVETGLVTVYSRHTTAAIKINEHEPLLLQDFQRLLRRLCPPMVDYRHNDLGCRTGEMCEDETPNGHAHCQHLLLPTSEQIPVTGGQLALGRWQRIFLIELDRSRRREVVVYVTGCGPSGGNGAARTRPSGSRSRVRARPAQEPAQSSAQARTPRPRRPSVARHWFARVDPRGR